MKKLVLLLFFFPVFCHSEQNTIAYFNLNTLLEKSPAIKRFCPELNAFFRQNIPAVNYPAVQKHLITELKKIQTDTERQCQALTKRSELDIDRLKEQNLRQQKPFLTGVENIYLKYITAMIELSKDYAVKKERLLSPYLSQRAESQKAWRTTITNIQNQVYDLATQQGFSIILQSYQSQQELQKLFTDDWFLQCVVKYNILPLDFKTEILTNGSFNYQMALWSVWMNTLENQNTSSPLAFRGTDLTDMFINQNND